jgi:hypothetical protein
MDFENSYPAQVGIKINNNKKADDWNAAKFDLKSLIYNSKIKGGPAGHSNDMDQRVGGCVEQRQSRQEGYASNKSAILGHT